MLIKVVKTLLIKIVKTLLIKIVKTLLIKIVKRLPKNGSLHFTQPQRKIQPEDHIYLFMVSTAARSIGSVCL